MEIQYMPLLQKEKNGRYYTFILPLDAPFDDSISVALEIIEGIKEIKKKREEQEEARKAEALASQKPPEEVPVEVINS